MKTICVIVALFIFPAFTINALDVEASNAGCEHTSPNLHGAWISQSQGFEEMLLFVNNYLSHTRYSKENKKFEFTRGGVPAIDGGNLSVRIEFNSADKEQVGKTVLTKYSLSDDRLITEWNGKRQEWRLVDKGGKALAGCWRINGRLEGDKMNPIKLAPRKTIKILSGTKFQWAAINTSTGEFFGTGGGTYTFENGKYTEHIEFFSRDNSRVGASLVFDASVKDGVWLHTGLSSKGDPVKETWISCE